MNRYDVTDNLSRKVLTDASFNLKALSFYKNSFEIQRKALSSNHPDTQNLRENIKIIKKKFSIVMFDESQNGGLLAVSIFSPPPNHINLASSYGNIGNVHHKTDEHWMYFRLKKITYLNRKCFTKDVHSPTIKRVNAW